MPRPRLELPTYRLHKQSGLAVVTLRNPDGTRREVALGVYGSPESKAEYARICAGLRPGGVVPAADDGYTVTELCVAYFKHAQAYYRDADGAATGEVDEIRYTLRAFRARYGDTRAAAFGPRALAAFRDALVAGDLCRTLVNQRVGKVKRMFKWAAAQELVPAAVFHGLQTLGGLRAGRSAARETEPVGPADPAAVAAALPHLAPHARALVELLRLTGMRPGEACRLTLGQLDRTGDVWVYTARRHKNRHKGKGRTVAFGPAAQEVVLRHLGATALGPDEPLFSPRRQKAELLAARAAARKTPLYPSHARHRAKRQATKGSRRLPGERYTADAVAKACKKACAKAGVAAWTPYQLRHLKGKELREQLTLEHVRAALGHSHAAMSAHYAAGADAPLAAEAAAKTG